MMKPNFLDMSKILTSKRIYRLFDAVEAHGGTLRFVGGAVRDTLAGRHNNFDLDLASDLSPDELVEACEDYGLKTVPIGLKFGTIGVIIDNQALEVTSLRRDVITDGRHAEVEFTDDWSVDASRRDLTINAVYADLYGNVFDYYNGINDLENGIVRFIGNPDERIKEDYLRIMRFFRFYSIFSKQPMNKEALKACVANKDGLRTLSIERVRDELFKLLVTPKAAETMQIIFDNDILSYFLPSKSIHINALKHLTELVEDMKYEGNFLRRLFVLYQPNASEAENMARTLRFSKQQKDNFINWAKINLMPENISTPSQRLRFIYRYGKTFCLDKILLTAAIYNIESSKVANVLQEVEDAVVPIFPLRGRDLIEQNIATGEKIGQTLILLEQQWIDSNFNLTRNELLEFAKKAI